MPSVIDSQRIRQIIEGHDKNWGSMWGYLSLTFNMYFVWPRILHSRIQDAAKYVSRHYVAP